MTHQEIFDNFINLVNGKGAAVLDGACVYVKEGHPGCAIGCQPGFREIFMQECESDSTLTNNSVGDLLFCSSDIADFFDGCDVDFLIDIQEFHDEPDNWDGKEVDFGAVTAFAEKWELDTSCVTS